MSVEADIAEVSQSFARVAAAHLPSQDNTPIGLAVSGGGDSIAMLHLAHRYFGPTRLHVLTVDHGLREGAAAEIALVAEQAKTLNLPHQVSRWSSDGTGNLQAAAREGRWEAITDWAKRSGIATVCLGHTQDDQVETLLMRLARGSGIDGLAAMKRCSRREGLVVLRPLLDVSRDDIREWLQNENIRWCDDPSNEDRKFDRVRTRQMLDQLADLGLTRKRLLQTIDHMQAAQVGLQKAAMQFARDNVRQDAGDLIFEAAAMTLDDADAPRRVLAAGFGWIGGRHYRPRFAQMCHAAAKVINGQTMTLGGCLLTRQEDGTVRMTREAAATAMVHYRSRPERQNSGIHWDGRWFLEGDLQDDLTVRALGDGIKECPDWRVTGLPRRSLLASPSVWQGDRLIAAPLAGLSNGWTARIVADFHSTAFAIED